MEFFINDIRAKKDVDLLLVDKLKLCLIHRYDTIINYFELLKEELYKLKKVLKYKYIKFKKEYDSHKFESYILLNSIREINDKLSIVNTNFVPFLAYKENENLSYTYRIINFRKIIEEKKIHYLVTPIKSFYFHDFNIIVYPFGIDGDSEFLEFQFNCYSKIKFNYAIKVNFEFININRAASMKYEARLVVCSKFLVGKFYNLSNLEKEGFIQENGDLIIKYTIDFNGKNNFIYDVDSYYEKFVVKGATPKLCELKDTSENLIHIKSEQKIEENNEIGEKSDNNKGEVSLLGKKTRLFKTSLKLKQ